MCIFLKGFLKHVAHAANFFIYVGGGTAQKDIYLEGLGDGAPHIIKRLGQLVRGHHTILSNRKKGDELQKIFSILLDTKDDVVVKHEEDNLSSSRQKC